MPGDHRASFPLSWGDAAGQRVTATGNFAHVLHCWDSRHSRCQFLSAWLQYSGSDNNPVSFRKTEKQLLISEKVRAS